MLTLINHRDTGDSQMLIIIIFIRRLLHVYWTQIVYQISNFKLDT